MSEIGNISVSINGDASGLLSAAASAQAAVTSLNSAINGLKSSNVSIALNAVDNASAVVKTASGTIKDFGALKPEAMLSALDKTASGVASAKRSIAGVQDKTVTITVRVNYEGGIGGFAKGTMSAPKGLARINDEKGVADPRELIYHSGNYYLFEGRDVLVPLDKGDRVYTASQTKDIMRMNGIPSYASGKNNELEAYVIERSKLNDWEKYGDSALSAFARVRDTNSELLNQGVITWEEYCDTISDIGADMYNERIKHSENWLNQEYKYNNMAVEDYIAGLDRMAQYTQEYYDNGLIGDVDYFYEMQEISNKKADMTQKANSDEYKAWKKSAEGWYKQRELYGDWELYGDSPVEYYKRCIERQKEFFEAGKIDWETYNDSVIGYKMDLYSAEKDEAEQTYNQLLNYAKEYTSDVKAALKTEKNELNYKLKTEELDEEFIDAARTKVIYAGAVTQKGKDVYKEADKKINDISREREKLELDRKQSEILAELESQYKAIEKSKNVTIGKIMNGTIDVTGILSVVESEFASGQSNICSLLNELIGAVRNSGGGTVYGGTTYNITGADASFVGPLLQRSVSALAG